jgi:hypothetical protein
MSQDGDRGKDRDYDDGDRKELRHMSRFPPASRSGLIAFLKTSRFEAG